VRIEKRAKATVTEQTKTAPSITTYANGVTIEDVDEEAEGNADQSQEMTDNTPETRVRVRFFTLYSSYFHILMWHVPFACFIYIRNKQIYQELAQQKKEKEDRANVNAPKKRNYEKEQEESIKAIRDKEAEEAG